MSGETVHVEFPDKLKVTAPETDKAIDALATAFKALGKMLEEGFVSMGQSLAEVKGLHSAIGGVRDDMSKHFGTLLEQTLSASVFARLANILAAKEKIKAIGALREDKLEQVSGDVRQLTGRYEKILDGIAQDCTRQIRELDSHAFEIVDDIYPTQVQQRFSLESTPTVNLLAEHAEQTAFARTACLSESVAETVGTIEATLSERRDDLERLYSLAVDGIQPGWYELPVLVVERSETGSEEPRLDFVIVGRRGVPVRVPREMVKSLEENAESRMIFASRRPLTDGEINAVAGTNPQMATTDDSVRAALRETGLELIDFGEVSA